MTFEEIFAWEDQNRRNVYMFLQGTFFCMFNQSAHLFLRDIQNKTREGKPFNVKYGIVKKLNREYFKIGIPSVELRRYIHDRKVYDVPGLGGKVCHLVLDRDLSESEYELWCREVAARGLHRVAPSRITRLLEGQPFRGTARDIFMEVLTVRGNIEKRYDDLGHDAYVFARDILLGCVKYYQCEDRVAESARLSALCWDLETLLNVMAFRHLASDNAVCLLGERLDSLRAQLRGMGCSSARKRGRAALAAGAVLTDGMTEKDSRVLSELESFEPTGGEAPDGE